MALVAFVVVLAVFVCPAAYADRVNMSTNGQFDYIIVGAGSAGSVLARRLTECPDVNVLLLEAGGCPPLESIMSYYFSLQPQTSFDYNMTTVDDGFAAQNLQGKAVRIIGGKMLGGTSSLHHLLHIAGDKKDYNDWAKLTGNATFNYENMLPYLKKMECVVDSEILSEYGSFHGTKGPIKVKRQMSPENKNIMAAFEEMGIIIKSDTNNDDHLGVNEPLLSIGDYIRQSGLTSYIRPVKNRPNLHVLTNAIVSKVQLDENNAATGVEFTHSNNIYTVNSKETILSAGAIKTPQILMLSGVGVCDHLRSVDIKCRVNNSHVGENLQDHTAANLAIGLEPDSSLPRPPNPTEFPGVMTTAYASYNKCQNYADYQAINLIASNNSTGILRLCSDDFKYKPEICQRTNEGNVGKKIMYVVFNLLRTESRGNIRLKNTDIYTQPIVNLNLLNDPIDVINLGKSLAHFSKILDTTYFKSIGAEFIDVGVCKEHTYGTDEFWRCYAVAMSASMWHFAGTCVLNKCLDNSFKVVGTSHLRVVDASAMPLVIRGNINVGVVVLAEKAADIIKIEDGLSCSE